MRQCIEQRAKSKRGKKSEDKEMSKRIVHDDKGFCEERSDAAICLIKSGCQIKGQL